MVRSILGGTLDDKSWLRPTVHVWTRSKQPWIVLPESDQQFDVSVPVDFETGKPDLALQP
jgi:hypothetical protein